VSAGSNKRSKGPPLQPHSRREKNKLPSAWEAGRDESEEIARLTSACEVMILVIILRMTTEVQLKKVRK